MAKIMRRRDGTVINIEKIVDDIESGVEPKVETPIAEVKPEETEDFNIIETPTVKPEVKPEVKIETPTVKPEVKPIVKDNDDVERWGEPEVKPEVKPVIETPTIKSEPIVSDEVKHVIRRKVIVDRSKGSTFLEEFNEWLDSPEF